MKVNQKFKSDILKASALGLLAFSTFLPAKGQGVFALKEVNTPYDEQQPVLSSKEELFVTVAYHPDNIGGSRDLGDVWYSKKNAFNQWQETKPVQSLSTSGYDLLIGFPDDNTALVYHDGKQKKHGIHLYRRTGETSWEYVNQLDFGSFKNNGSSFSARLHPSGSILVMSMNSYGTFGNEDIYISFKKGEGKWTVPQNLGPDVNTFEQEMTPFLDDNKQVLYFSTNGHGTGEGRDIFYTQRMDDSWEKWTTPRRLQEDINSQGVELSYFIDPNSPYTAFVTTTQNSEGYGDILMRRKEEIVLEDIPAPADQPYLASSYPVRETAATPAERAPVEEETTISLLAKEEALPTIAVDTVRKEAEAQSKVLEVVVAEVTEDQSTPIPIPKVEPGEQAKTLEPGVLTGERLRLSVLDKESMAEISYKVSLRDADGRTIEVLDDLMGVKEIPLREQTDLLVVSSDRYLPEAIAVKGISGEQLVMLTPAKAGMSLVLRDVLFEKGTAELAQEQTYAYIDKLVVFMQENPLVKIRLEGHTDNVGNAALNKQLSMNRAKAIRDYMVDSGVAFERMMIRGNGGADPVADNDTEVGREQNRRVEMVIIN